MDDIADLGTLADLTPTAEAREPLLNGPKRQHFLPRFYLAGFCRDELLAVYDRDRDEVRHQRPEATGVIGHFYTFEDDQGRKRYEVEQALAEQEAKAAPIIRKLVAKQSLTDDERCDLAIFIALGMCRTPDHIDSIKAVNGQMIKHVARAMFSDSATAIGKFSAEAAGEVVLRERPLSSGKRKLGFRTSSEPARSLRLITRFRLPRTNSR